MLGLLEYADYTLGLASNSSFFYGPMNRLHLDLRIAYGMYVTRCGFCSFEKRKAYCPPALTSKTFATNDTSDPSISGTDTSTLRQSLSEMRHELEHIEAELEFAEAAVFRMKAKRSCVLSSIRDYEETLRPIVSVPDDILRLIFEWTVHLCSDWHSPQLLDLKIAPPWTITYTCSRWRALAISHRPLWCNLVVPLINSTHLLRLSLQRSANAECGLAVDIPYRDGPVSQFIDIFKTVFMPILEPTSHRWYSLKAAATSAFFNESFSGWPLERLTHLDLSFDGFHAAVTSFNNTPRLVHLNVHNLRGDCDLDINWERLTFYRSERSNLRLLSRLSAVETLELDVLRHNLNVEPASTAFKAIAPLHLPSLKSLSLLSCRSDALESLSDILMAPALRHLYVTMTSGGSNRTMLCLNTHFLEHVTHLSIIIDIWPKVPDYVHEFLRRAGRVSSLHLGFGAFDTTVLSALQSTDMLPFLEHLYIDVQSMEHLAADVLMVVEARHCMLTVVKQPEKAPHEDWKTTLRVDLLDRWYILCGNGTITTYTKKHHERINF